MHRTNSDKCIQSECWSPKCLKDECSLLPEHCAQAHVWISSSREAALYASALGLIERRIKNGTATVEDIVTNLRRTGGD